MTRSSARDTITQTTPSLITRLKALPDDILRTQFDYKFYDALRLVSREAKELAYEREPLLSRSHPFRSMLLANCGPRAKTSIFNRFYQNSPYGHLASVFTEFNEQARLMLTKRACAETIDFGCRFWNRRITVTIEAYNTLQLSQLAAAWDSLNSCDIEINYVFSEASDRDWDLVSIANTVSALKRSVKIGQLSIFAFVEPSDSVLRQRIISHFVNALYLSPNIHELFIDMGTPESFTRAVLDAFLLPSFEPILSTLYMVIDLQTPSAKSFDRLVEKNRNSLTYSNIDFYVGDNYGSLRNVFATMNSAPNLNELVFGLFGADIDGTSFRLPESIEILRIVQIRESSGSFLSQIPIYRNSNLFEFMTAF